MPGGEALILGEISKTSWCKGEPKGEKEVTAQGLGIEAVQEGKVQKDPMRELNWSIKKRALFSGRTA